MPWRRIPKPKAIPSLPLTSTPRRPNHPLGGAALLNPRMSTRGEMSPPRRRRTSPPPASLPVDDDMLREILLRLPPSPSSLPRASLVCKRWRRLVADPRFQRRFRKHHGKPPLLGFFVGDFYSYTFAPMLDPPDRIPAARFSMPQHQEGDGVIDCRHGLALLHGRRPPRRLVVWDPVARVQHLLIPPPQLESDHMFIVNGAVLRPVGRHGCRSSHFQVALIARDRQSARVSAGLYSSETGIWGNISSSFQVQPIVTVIGTSTLIGNSLCWLIQRKRQYIILEFDLDRQRLAVTELPPHIQNCNHQSRIMPAEDGGLGFIYLTQSPAQLWKRIPDSVWVLDRAIEFENLLGSTYNGEPLSLVGFAEESNAVLVRTHSDVFLIYLRSMEFKKLSDMNFLDPHYPFEYCYAAGTGILDGHDGDEVLNNM